MATQLRAAIIVVLISAGTDALIIMFTAFTSASVATGSTALPTKGVVFIALSGGVVAGLRTIQQWLRARFPDVNTLESTDHAG